MKRIFCILAFGAIVFASCQREEVFVDRPSDVKSDVLVVDTKTRSYDEALAIAEDALKLLEGKETRSTTKRVIKRSEGQTVMRHVTRGSETEEEPIMYVFNNEDNQGFTVVAADRSQQPLIAVTEYGNYTFGKPTGVEPFDLLMEDVVTTLSFNPPTLIDPEIPLDPTPGCYFDTVDIYERMDPLIATKWHQEGIFGNECTNGVSGCAATAFGQIMAYHGYPASITLTHNNNTNLSLDWDNIRRIITGNEIFLRDREPKEQIGLLLREIGERMNMYYDNDRSVSGATSQNILRGIRNLGYSAASINENTTVGLDFFELKYNIGNGFPVIVLGVREGNIGHAWIADGIHRREYAIYMYVTNPNYDPTIIYNNPEPPYILGEITDQVFERLVHYNWGRPNGSCNGWFTTSCYSLDDAESYDNNQSNNHAGSIYNYCYDIVIISDIQPNN